LSWRLAERSLLIEELEMSNLEKRLKRIEDQVKPKRGAVVFTVGKDDLAYEEYLASGGDDLIVLIQPQGDTNGYEKKHA
jgi:hypothetical protein